MFSTVALKAVHEHGRKDNSSSYYEQSSNKDNIHRLFIEKEI